MKMKTNRHHVTKRRCHYCGDVITGGDPTAFLCDSCFDRLCLRRDPQAGVRSMQMVFNDINSRLF
jgi:hypothetical protein